MLTFHGDNLGKSFNRKMVFESVSFLVTTHETLLITGRNGSGKSTLAKILAGVLTPTEGSIRLDTGAPVSPEDHRHAVGFVAPYLQLYDEFSASENLSYALEMRGYPKNTRRADMLLDMLGILHRKNDPLRTYSSGMKQRVKYAFALMHEPHLLILDEPTSNLDVHGLAVVRDIMREQNSGGILVVATNDFADVEHYEHRIDLDAR